MKRMSLVCCSSFLILFFLLSAASTQFFIEYITSDYLYLFETANNLLQFKTVSGQNFPAAPYFFPDMLVTMALMMFTHNLTLLHFIYSLLFLVFYSVVCTFLMKESVSSKKWALIGAGMAVSLGFLPIPFSLTFLRDWPGSHLSALVFGLYFLHFYLKSREHSKSIQSLFGFFVLVFLVFISDKIVFSQAIFPLSLIILLDVLFKKTDKKIGVSFFLLFFLVLLGGVLFDHALVRYGNASFSLNVSLFRIRHAEQLPTTVWHALVILKESIAEQPLYYTLLGFFNGVGLLLAILLYVKRKAQLTKGNFLRVLWFFYLVEVSSFFLSVCVGKLTASAHLRYLDSLYLFPSMIFVWVVVHCITYRFYAKFLVSVLIVIFIFSLIAFFKINGDLLSRFRFNPPYNAFVACVDALSEKFPLRAGIADYWDVREVRMLSKKGIWVTQVNQDLEFVNLIDNENTLYQNRQTREPFVYQFIILNPQSISPLSKERIRKKVGSPDKIVACEHREVWLYVSRSRMRQLNG